MLDVPGSFSLGPRSPYPTGKTRTGSREAALLTQALYPLGLCSQWSCSPIYSLDCTEEKPLLPTIGHPLASLTWRRSAYCFFTSGIEADTFRSVSRSFFRLVLASERMISRLILKGTEGQDGQGKSGIS